MGCSVLRCESVAGPDRRTLLAGLAGSVAILPAAALGAEPARSLGQFVTETGPSDLARSLSGTRLTLRGYLAPSLDGLSFAMSEASPAPCQLCGELHDPGRSLGIRLAERRPGTPVMALVEVEGELRLSPDAALLLADARVRPL